MKSSFNKVLLASLLLAFVGGHAFAQVAAKSAPAPAKVAQKSAVPRLEKCAKGPAGKACRDAKSKKIQAVAAQSGKPAVKLDPKSPAAKLIKKK